MSEEVSVALMRLSKLSLFFSFRPMGPESATGAAWQGQEQAGVSGQGWKARSHLHLASACRRE